MSKTSQQNLLTGADMLLGRRRANVTQEELAGELGWYRQLLMAIEGETIELSQNDYRRILDALDRITAARREDKAAQETAAE